jgi:hypothetical protein
MPTASHNNNTPHTHNNINSSFQDDASGGNDTNTACITYIPISDGCVASSWMVDNSRFSLHSTTATTAETIFCG